MQKILAFQKIARTYTKNMYMTKRQKMMGVGTSMPMLQGREIKKVTWNLFKQMMKNLLILWQAPRCRSLILTGD
eukprot:2927951-Prorocentrum_lima.AAC.1